MPVFNLRTLFERLHRRQKDAFFLQIGAMDGRTYDPIHEFVRLYGWRGLLVEPLKDHFERLEETYADCGGLAFENAAVTDHTGPGTMYRIPTETVRSKRLPSWGLGAGSFFKDRNALAWKEIEPLVVEETVPCLTLEDLIVKHAVTTIDVLQIDAEGYDYRILRQLDFDRFRPYVVNLETVNLPKNELTACKQLLDRHDYLYAKAGYDLLAVSLPV